MTNKINPADFGRVVVLMGGWSAEREVSLMSGKEVLNSLKRQGIDAHGIDADRREIIGQIQAAKPDRVFIILHGSDGECGLIQALLEGLGIPYTGSGQAACALTLDKLRSKWLFAGVGLPVAKSEILTTNSDWQAVADKLGLPLFVKPSRDGSSLGVTKVKTVDQFASAYHEAAKLDPLVFAESFVDGPEYSVPIVGDKVFPSICIRPANEFYDYEAKYFVDTTEYDCPSGLTSSEEQLIKDLAWRAFQACGCKGWGRVDFMRCRKTGHFYILEINTVPGMTTHSLPPKSAATIGIDFDALTLAVLSETL